MKKLKETLTKDEQTLKEIMLKWRALMLDIPNLPDISVPEGGEADSKEVRKWGEPKEFGFKPKNHIELMQKLNMVDLERGVKVSGFRGYFLKGDGALLSLAVMQFAIDELIKKGYELFITPSLVRGENFLATGHFPKGKDDIYKTQDELYLSGTSEVPLTGYHLGEILEKSELPKKYVALSPCFRREAGSYGKDTKGLFRVHEFYKVEQFILCEANHETSINLHEEILQNAEELVQALGLPYRVIILATGDMSQGSVKTCDIETWMPSEAKFRETHSASYYHDFQARRANIKYKNEKGEKTFVHSLNSTAIPSPRILAAIVENFQQSDGSITVPKVLEKYLGKKVIS